MWDDEMKTNRLILTIVSIFSLVSLVFAADTDNLAGYCGGMMSGLYGGYGTSFMLVSWIFYIAIIGLIIAGIYWMIKSANSKK